MRVAARDTDGLLLRLDDDSDRRSLGEVLGRFRVLSPDGVSPFWSVELHHDGRPLWGIVTAAKRYVLFTRNDDGSLCDVVKFTEHALAGAVVDPPLLAGRDAKRKHHWARAVAVAAARRALAAEKGEPAATFDACWDEPGTTRFPSIVRLQASTPDQVAALAPRLSVRPFGCYLRAEVDAAFGKGEAPIALDPGTDCSEWQSLDWRDAEGVTTAPGAGGTVLATLADKASRWLRPRPWVEPRPVVVRLTVPGGRAGPVLDAQAADPETDASDLRVRYDEQTVSALRQLAADVGSRGLHRVSGISRSSAARLANGQAPRPTTVRRALDGLRGATTEARTCSCGRPIVRPNSRTCSKRCRDAAYRERRKSTGESAR